MEQSKHSPIGLRRVYERQKEQLERLCKRAQVLSDPDKRTVYDVYGEEGLRAGMELSTDVRDIRSAYERIKAKQVPCSTVPLSAYTSLTTVYGRRSVG